MKKKLGWVWGREVFYTVLVNHSHPEQRQDLYIFLIQETIKDTLCKKTIDPDISHDYGFFFQSIIHKLLLR